MEYDLLVFIGRFQPFHNGHLTVAEQALAKAQHLLVLAGAPQEQRTLRNPFTVAERVAQILAALPHTAADRVTVAAIEDVPGDDTEWVRRVREAANACIGRRQGRIGLIGHCKDHTSYYLKLFPEWGAIEVANHKGINATELRDLYFAAGAAQFRNQVPAPIYTALVEFTHTQAYAELKAKFGEAIGVIQMAA